jgi:hypothetical protein
MTELSRNGHRARVTAMLTVACCALAGLVFAEAGQATHGPTPVGASPTRVTLVPWFEECVPAGVNSEHAAPYPYAACAPPDRAAGPATTSIAIMGSSSAGFVRYVVCPAGSVAAFCTPAGGVMPLPDVRITGNVVDVQCAVAGPPGCPVVGDDYDPNLAVGPYGTPGTGSTPPTPPCFPGGACVSGADVEVAPELPGSTLGGPAPQGSPSYRVTGHRNCDTAPPNAPPGPPCPLGPADPDYGATMIDVSGTPPAAIPDPPGIPMDCIPTAAAATGSSCGVNTTLNALVPGGITAGREETVQIGQIRLRDSGPNGVFADAFDPRDNMVFAVQGVFFP